jgi:hypothetical protein
MRHVGVVVAWLLRQACLGIPTSPHCDRLSGLGPDGAEPCRVLASTELGALN